MNFSQTWLCIKRAEMLQVRDDPLWHYTAVHRTPEDLMSETKLGKCSPVTASFGYDRPTPRNYCRQYHHTNQVLVPQTWALAAQAMGKHRAKKERL